MWVNFGRMDSWSQTCDYSATRRVEFIFEKHTIFLGLCDHDHFPSSLGVYWWLFNKHCIKSKVPKQLKGSIWDKYPLQIILIISGRDKVPLTFLVHAMVSADCNSSVWSVQQTASPLWGSLRLIIDTHSLFGGTIRTWDHYASANPATYQERSNISGCGIDKTYLYNASNYINLGASGPRPRLISNNVQTQWCTSPLEKDRRFLQK